MKLHGFLIALLLFGFCGKCDDEAKVSRKILDADQPHFGNNDDVFDIGVIIDMGSWEGEVIERCIKMAISNFYDVNDRFRTRISLHMRDSRGDSLHSVSTALDLLDNVNVQAIIVPIISNKELFLTTLGEKAKVPFLSFSSIPQLEKHPYFIQVGEDDPTQFHAISSLIESFEWKRCSILYEDTSDGRQDQSYLYDILQESHMDLIYQISFRTTDDKKMTSKLRKVINMRISIIIVHVSPALASRIFASAKRLGMMSRGFAWIVTTKTMNFLNSFESSDYESMQGVIGLKSYIPKSVKTQNFALRWRREFQLSKSNLKFRELNVFGLWAFDAMWALTDAIEYMSRDFNRGSTLMSKISSSNFTGLAGEFRLTNRKLVPTTYEIVNIIGEGGRRVGLWSTDYGLSKGANPSVKYSSNVNLEPMIWPGISLASPGSWLVKMSGKSFRVGIPEDVDHAFVKINHDPQKNLTTFDGFCIDVFRAALDRLPHDLSVEFIPFNGSYNELVQQVYLKTYDAAVGDITIHSNRSQYVDFTVTYTDLGVGILAKFDEKDGWFFLKPLDPKLWILSAGMFLVTGIIVWLIERPINQQFQGPPAQQVGTLLWFAASTLVYAHRENLESKLSKFVVSIWLFVVLVLTSSYTANLSSLLTIQQFRLTKNDYIGYSAGNDIVQGLTVNNLNFVDNRLKPYQSLDDYLDALSQGNKKGGVPAIIDEIPYIKLFLGRYPHGYTMIKSSMITSGFGFAFQKGSPLVYDISRAISELREEGKLFEMERRWFTNQLSVIPSETQSLGSITLGIDNLSGLFIVSGISKGTALFIFIIILIWKRISVKFHAYRVLAAERLVNFWREMSVLLSLFNRLFCKY